MRTGRILSLDMAPNKTGFSLLGVSSIGDIDSIKDCLIRYGLIDEPTTARTEFPWNYVDLTNSMVDRILDLIRETSPDYVVVEQSNLGKQRGSQKRIEWCHFALTERFLNASPRNRPEMLHFVDSSAWRHHLGLRLSKDQKKSNAKLSKAKKVAAETGAEVDKKALGVKGKVNWKHLSVERANAIFGLKLKMKDNDTCDAINIAEAFVRGVKTNEEP